MSLNFDNVCIVKYSFAYLMIKVIVVQLKRINEVSVCLGSLFYNIFISNSSLYSKVLLGINVKKKKFELM